MCLPPGIRNPIADGIWRECDLRRAASMSELHQRERRFISPTKICLRKIGGICELGQSDAIPFHAERLRGKNAKFNCARYRRERESHHRPIALALETRPVIHRKTGI